MQFNFVSARQFHHHPIKRGEDVKISRAFQQMYHALPVYSNITLFLMCLCQIILVKTTTSAQSVQVTQRMFWAKIGTHLFTGDPILCVGYQVSLSFTTGKKCFLQVSMSLGKDLSKQCHVVALRISHTLEMLPVLLINMQFKFSYIIYVHYFLLQ